MAAGRALDYCGSETESKIKGKIKGPTSMYTLMSAKTRLLREPLVTDVALIGAHFVDQRLDVLL